MKIILLRNCTICFLTVISMVKYSSSELNSYFPVSSSKILSHTKGDMANNLLENIKSPDSSIPLAYCFIVKMLLDSIYINKSTAIAPTRQQYQLPDSFILATTCLANLIDSNKIAKWGSKIPELRQEFIKRYRLTNEIDTALADPIIFEKVRFLKYLESEKGYIESIGELGCDEQTIKKLIKIKRDLAAIAKPSSNLRSVESPTLTYILNLILGSIDDHCQYAKYLSNVFQLNSIWSNRIIQMVFQQYEYQQLSGTVSSNVVQEPPAMSSFKRNYYVLLKDALWSDSLSINQSIPLLRKYSFSKEESIMIGHDIEVFAKENSQLRTKINPADSNSFNAPTIKLLEQKTMEQTSRTISKLSDSSFFALTTSFSDEDSVHDVSINGLLYPDLIRNQFFQKEYIMLINTFYLQQTQAVNGTIKFLLPLLSDSSISLLMPTKDTKQLQRNVFKFFSTCSAAERNCFILLCAKNINPHFTGTATNLRRVLNHEFKL